MSTVDMPEAGLDHLEVFPAASEIAPDVLGVTTGVVNLAMVGPKGAGDRGWTLIDAGLPGFSGRILKLAAERFGEGARPAAILLTHGHHDHVGALPVLLKAWPDTPVYAHTFELPYLDGRDSYPPPDPTVGGGMMSRTGVFFRRSFNFWPNIRPYSWDADDLPGELTLSGVARRSSPIEAPTLSGWQVIETPGHSPGHVSFYRPSDGVLIVGDAFVTTKQESVYSAITQRYAPQGPPWYFTADFRSSRRSIQELAALKPQVALTGHGPAVRGKALESALELILREWETSSTPRKGRYRRLPAVTDAHGVLYLPPKPWDPVKIGAIALAGIAGVALGTYLVRSRRRSV